MRMASFRSQFHRLQNTGIFSARFWEECKVAGMLSFKWMLAMCLAAGTTQAQWEILPSGSTADLRGIHSIGNGVAWASGTQGTVLRTTDNGKSWQRCATPPGAEALDFRGVQAFDARTAIVMSSGKGDLSRLYKTTDGCKGWKLIATNPDPDGFWDAVKGDPDFVSTGHTGEMVFVLGDSVRQELRVWEWKEGWEERELEISYEAKGKAEPTEASFAASNSVFQVVKTEQADKTWKYHLRWASGNADHAYMHIVRVEQTSTCEPCREQTLRTELPMANGSSNSGVFSFAFRDELVGVAVGGNFEKPDALVKTVAMTMDAGISWSASQTPPHGYRSAVAYDAASKAWITVGPNGTDVSTDDGRNWRVLRPDVSAGDAPDSDQHWNALSLPFVVGPHGRIGRIRPEALNHASQPAARNGAKP
jgi:photosystem II stability/assembly factor-like uncharacterized protein